MAEIALLSCMRPPDQASSLDSSAANDIKKSLSSEEIAGELKKLVNIYTEDSDPAECWAETYRRSQTPDEKLPVLPLNEIYPVDKEDWTQEIEKRAQ